ncbi:MAG: multifunctional CCA addition/repair protein, partial [Zoogloeaceae bacterium]|nr:multifunctional CCA addition/repair protein [Zoogloeaceae bacterium]
MKIYAVGGAVRDRLLERPVHDCDHVVVGATPEILLAQGFLPVGKDFPVFLHPETHAEYALARTEKKHGHGYHGFLFHAAPDVTLEEDLARRDLTINAMAEDDTGQIIDPFGGQQDLKAKVLRHVSPAFAEDPVRILRIARFAARFADFSIAPETLALMRRMVADGEVDHLVAERVWQEIARGLMEDTPSRMIETLRDCGALARLMPEVEALFGVPERLDFHPEGNSGYHLLLVLDAAARLGLSLPARYAALCHDLGKAATPRENWPHHHGHDVLGVPIANALSARLKVPNDCRDLAALTCREHINIHYVSREAGQSGMRPGKMAALLERCDLRRRPQRFAQLLDACHADHCGRIGHSAPFSQEAIWHKAAQAFLAVDDGAIARAWLAQGGDPK